MTVPDYSHALIVGAGSGLSASLARAFSGAGLKVSLAARDPGKLSALCAGTGALAFPVDVADSASVARLFGEVDDKAGAPDVVVFNPSYRTRGPVAGLDPDEVQRCLTIGAFGGFLVAQAAARKMAANRHGAIFFTGASASVKGYAQSAPFAMGKFGLRGLAQSMARELAPKGIHVAHFVIDGGIAAEAQGRTGGDDKWLLPDAIAASYLHVHRQHRSAWTWEVELRPWVENF
jgi:NAD(P)-dependent dehydrogenase (short-subunit alcohol dehydrogenase family)